MSQHEAAFPRPSVVWDSKNGTLGGEQGCAGMSLRDWFAGQALTGLVANKDFHGTAMQGSPTGVAETAFQIADAMLRQRDTTTAGA